jgi:hypothetical protein
VVKVEPTANELETIAHGNNTRKRRKLESKEQQAVIWE